MWMERLHSIQGTIFSRGGAWWWEVGLCWQETLTFVYITKIYLLLLIHPESQ